METPEELKERLIELFPAAKHAFDQDKDEHEEFVYTPPLSLHRVWMDFAPVAYTHLSEAPKKSVQRFSALINTEVAAGGERENAVSTCFLEHASEVAVRKLLLPLLSAEAKQELR